MLYLGLSGGIGSGKSTVSARLAELGAVVIDADALAREVVDRGSDGLAEVATRFGDDVLLPDGSLNRPALGAIVFADARARRDLESITHPRIRELTAQRHAAAPRDAIVVHDMPLLVESDLAPDYHLTLIVDAAEGVRIERIMRDRGMTRDAAQARIAAQATDKQRYAVADVLLDNNGAREQLLEQVETLWRERLSPYNDNLLADRGARRPVVVKISDADPSWPDVAARSIARLHRQLDAAGLAGRMVGVEHSGSAGMPGPHAEGVIDLQIRVDDVDLAPTPEFRSVLRRAGFVGGRVGEHTARVAVDFLGCDPAAAATLTVRGPSPAR